MSDAPLEERLAAVERALTDGEETPPELTALDQGLADRVGALEEDVAELEAAVQAVRGYVGSVKHVNDEVEQRADAAMAKVEALERAITYAEEDVSGRWKRTDAPDGAAATGGEDGGSTGPRPGGCPRCGAGRPGRRPHSESPPDPADPVEAGVGASEATDQESRQSVERRATRPDGRGGEISQGTAVGAAPGERDSAGASDRPAGTGRGDAISPDVDRDDEPEQRPGSVGRRIGHRRLQAPDEPDGLLARLKEVL